jgi:hypothetical protein
VGCRAPPPEAARYAGPEHTSCFAFHDFAVGSSPPPPKQSLQANRCGKAEFITGVAER